MKLADYNAATAIVSQINDKQTALAQLDEAADAKVVQVRLLLPSGHVLEITPSEAMQSAWKFDDKTMRADLQAELDDLNMQLDAL